MTTLNQAMNSGSFDYDVKTLKAFSNQAIAAYSKGRNLLHFVGCCLINHAVEHGDVTPFQKFLEDMGSKSQTRHRLAAWVRHHGRYEVDGKSKYAIIAKINDKGEVSVKIDGKEKSRIDVQKMHSEPYWDVLDIAKVKTGFELDNAVAALVARAIKETGATEAQIKDSVHKAYKAKMAA